ncbi:HEAT repeat domain-containing protein [Paenibacillus hemerocallicola]|uniref:HEAT repeat domain-containing protein n=1 Tax=Paenibacillus hemerocallicola TaxID=1172614 RepID=A0A5C4SVQ0_9BACL|nr:HEAT repeat domain-containing protein [Paenibacillus hemerocallicola]TNJ56305.1 HEAT repeat domain-containing protein [Paenibacillus hemerocallicola]
MNRKTVKSELPSNYEELKKAANRTSNWRERLEAVEELGKWKNEQTIDILTHRMKNDAVYRIQEAAFRKLKAFGEEVQMPPRKKGELIKGTTKVLVRIKKSLPEEHTYEQFKDKLKKTRVDVFDTYEGDKGADFEQWLESAWASLSRK